MTGGTRELHYEYTANRVSRTFIYPVLSLHNPVPYDFYFGYDGLGRLETLRYSLIRSTDYRYFYDKASNVTHSDTAITMAARWIILTITPTGC